MKKSISILIFTIFSKLLSGQTNSTVAKMFYGLPLDSSRQTICNKLNSDKRFVATRKSDSNSFPYNYKPDYLGLCLDKGLTNSKADSIEIEFAHGVSMTEFKTNGKSNLRHDLILKTRYYFSSADTAKKEYYSLLKFIRTIGQDSSYTDIETNYTNTAISREYKAKGMSFVNRKPFYSVDILLCKVTINYFGVFLTYVREEK